MNIEDKGQVYRIWHPDNLFKTLIGSELSTITSFKSCLINDSTTAQTCRDFVASKLMIEDPTQFDIYSIKNDGLFYFYI